MKSAPSFITCGLLSLALFACKGKPGEGSGQNAGGEAPASAENASDVPLLALKKGDWLAYRVDVLVPEGAKSPGSAEETRKYLRVRTYEGKSKPQQAKIPTDTFLVTSSNKLADYEYLEIAPDLITIRSSELAGIATAPFWLDPPCLLVRSGVKGGEIFPKYITKDPKSGAVIQRVVQVIGREKIELIGKEFDCTRMTVSGADGGMEMRRSIWFAPGTGIVKDERTNYFEQKLLYREVQTLIAMGGENDIPPL